MSPLLADLHIHVDYNRENDHWHGARPEKVAEQIVERDLDIFAITEHDAVTNRYFEVEEEVARLCDVLSARQGVHKCVQALLGAELNVMFQGRRYHVGYVHEEPFRRGGLPDLPPPRSDMAVIEQYKRAHPGVCILNHPTWKDHCRSDEDATQDFMESGLVDGIEIANGSILMNGSGKGFAEDQTAKACEMFLKAREKVGTLAAIGSSDAHKAKLVGCVATECEAQDADGFFAAIMKGKTKAVGLKKGVRSQLRHVLSSVNRLHPYLSVRYAHENGDE